jgi:hypothetical protein
MDDDHTRDRGAEVCAARAGFRAGAALVLVAATMTAAGCSGFGGPKAQQQPAAVDPNAYPASYRADIVAFLRQSLTQRADFRGAMISQPVLKPVGDNQHYVVCVQFSGRGEMKSKVAIYLNGQMNEFIDSTPAQCGDAVYQPFKELEGAVPAP